MSPRQVLMTPPTASEWSIGFAAPSIVAIAVELVWQRPLLTVAVWSVLVAATLTWVSVRRSRAEAPRTTRGPSTAGRRRPTTLEHLVLFAALWTAYGVVARVDAGFLATVAIVLAAFFVVGAVFSLLARRSAPA